MIGARSVWSGLCGAQTASASPTYGRLTEAGQGQLSWSGERLSMAVHGQTRMLNAPAVSKSFGSLLFILRFSFVKTKHSTVNCQPLRSFSRVKPVGDRLHRQQTHAKVKCTCSFRIRPKNKRLTSHCRGESRAGTPCNSFCFPRRRANHIALESDALP